MPIKKVKQTKINPPSFPKPYVVMDIRSAALCSSEIIKIENSIGRICADVRVPCPPAIPIAISGELIDKKAVDAMRFYGIKEVAVVSE